MKEHIDIIKKSLIEMTKEKTILWSYTVFGTFSSSPTKSYLSKYLYKNCKLKPQELEIRLYVSSVDKYVIIKDNSNSLEITDKKFVDELQETIDEAINDIHKDENEIFIEDLAFIFTNAKRLKAGLG